MKYIMHVIIMRNNSRCANLLAVLKPCESYEKSYLHTFCRRGEQRERDFWLVLIRLILPNQQLTRWKLSQAHLTVSMHVSCGKKINIDGILCVRSMHTESICHIVRNNLYFIYAIWFAFLLHIFIQFTPNLTAYTHQKRKRVAHICSCLFFPFGVRFGDLALVLLVFLLAKMMLLQWYFTMALPTTFTTKEIITSTVEKKK